MSRSLRKREILVLVAGIMLLQTLSSALFKAGFYVDLALVFVVYASRYLGPAESTVIGCLFGLTQDITGLQPLLGLNGFSKTAVALVAFLLIRKLVLSDFWSKSLLLLFLSIIDGFIILLLMTLLTSDPPSALANSVVSRAAMTALLGGPLLYFLDKIKSPEKDFSQIE
jgi:rod shape-determining protein MreD